MNSDLVLHIGRRTIELALLISAPVLIVTLVVGFLTAMLQAVTSLRDMTLGMVLKLGCVGLTLLIFGGWMLQLMVGFAGEIFNHMQAMGQ